MPHLVGKAQPQLEIIQTWRMTVIWLASATTGIISTKYLLVNKNFHFPWQLLFFHILLALLLHFVCRTIQRSRNHVPTLLDLKSWRGIISAARMLWTLSFWAVFALAMTVSSQVLLHLPSLTTAMMMFGLSIPTELLFLQAFDGSLWQGSIVLRILVSAACFALLQWDDYQITINGTLILGIPVAMVAGLAKALYTSACSAASDDEGEEDEIDEDRINLLISALVVTLMITAVLILIYEDPIMAMSKVGDAGIVLLFLNLGSNAIAIYYGGSIFWNFSLLQGCRNPGPSQAGIAATLTGLVALGYGLVARPSIVTPIQVVAYIAAIVFMMDARIVAEHLPMSWLRENPLAASKGYARLVQRLEDEHRIDEDSLIEMDGSSAEDRERRHDLTVGESSSMWQAARPCLRVIAAFCWLTLLCRSIYETYVPFHPRITSTLDHSYSPPRDLDIVVSMYDESPADVSYLLNAIWRMPNVGSRNPPIIIYDKNNAIDPAQLASDLAGQLPQVTDIRVIPRPNIGREGETFLRHMLTNWDTLAKHTMFLQGHVHNRWESLRRIEDYFVEDTGFLSFSFVGEVCPDCSKCGDHSGWSDHTPMISEMYARANHNATCKDLLLSYKGQFVASAARIRGNGRELYEYLLDVFMNPEHMVHQEPYWRQMGDGNRKDSMDAPIFGYTMERMWGAIMQCSDMGLARRCPTLISGTNGFRRGGSVADCQCLDNAA